MIRTFQPAWAAAALALAISATSACAPHAAESGAGKTAPSAAAFFAGNAKQPGVHVLADGLQYKVLRSGPADGAHPQASDTVKVDYEGTLLDGTVFDSTTKTGEPAVLPLDGLIPAWMEAIPMMRPGDEWVLYVPAALGYGDRETGPIPAGSALVFHITLKGILPSGKDTPNA